MSSRKDRHASTDGCQSIPLLLILSSPRCPFSCYPFHRHPVDPADLQALLAHLAVAANRAALRQPKDLWDLLHENRLGAPQRRGRPLWLTAAQARTHTCTHTRTLTHA